MRTHTSCGRICWGLGSAEVTLSRQSTPRLMLPSCKPAAMKYSQHIQAGNWPASSISCPNPEGLSKKRSLLDQHQQIVTHQQLPQAQSKGSAGLVHLCSTEYHSEVQLNIMILHSHRFGWFRMARKTTGKGSLLTSHQTRRGLAGKNLECILHVWP